MTEEQLARPIGWWLKEADARLEATFDRTFATAGRTRREWQVLSTLSARPTDSEGIVAALAPFAGRGDVLAAIDALTARGEVTATDGNLRLTEVGARTLAQLSPLAAQVRQRVSAALPQDDYVALVGLLARLVEGLKEP